VLVFGVTSVVAQIFLDYKRYVWVLRWLTLSLFAYVAALAFAHVSWGEALAGVLIPKITWRADSTANTGDALGRTALGFVGKLAGNAFAEFWPDLKKRIHHRKE